MNIECREVPISDGPVGPVIPITEGEAQEKHYHMTQTTNSELLDPHVGLKRLASRLESHSFPLPT